MDSYARAVLEGRAPAGRLVRLACERHLRDLKRRDVVFDVEAAGRAISFFAELRLPDDPEAPFVLQDWQAFIVGSLFGWKDSCGLRRFRTAYIETGKGNGKTPLLAGIALYMLVADGEWSAECYFAAVTRDQAQIAFRDARRIAESTPGLGSALDILQHNIAYHPTSSFLRPVSSEARSLDGKRVQFAGIDELHEHLDGTVVHKMRAGTKGRRQPLIVEITNAGVDRTSVCYEHHEYSRRILEGDIQNDTWFAYVSGLDVCDDCRRAGKTMPQDGCPACDDWTDPGVWAKANPNLGISVPESYLREQVEEAKGQVSKRALVRRLNFCIWDDPIETWITTEAWAACRDPSPPALSGERAYAGIDLAATRDTSALALWFPARRQVRVFFWIPSERLEERARVDGVPWREWAREGWVRLIPGSVMDVGQILPDVLRILAQYNVRQVALDRWDTGPALRELNDAGYVAYPCGQGYASLSAPAKELERMVYAGTLRHDGNPVLAWQVGNTSIEQDPAGNIKPSKARSRDRIDGVVALVMAIYAASHIDPVPEGTSLSIFTEDEL